MVTGNELIDSEHRTLFDAINNLMDACESGAGRENLEKTVDFMVDYVAKHFSDEQDLQKQNQYSNYKMHFAFHTNYKRDIGKLASEIRENGPTIQKLSDLNRQVGILISHIRTEDKRLAEFLRDQNDEGEFGPGI